MTKYAAIAIFVLRLIYQPSAAQAQDATILKSVSSTEVSAPLISNVKARVLAEKNMLDWDITDNSATGIFEIEKSTDGRHFTLAAIVFGSEEKNKAHYSFYEKATIKPVQYRIKLITRENRIMYTSPVSVRP